MENSPEKRQKTRDNRSASQRLADRRHQRLERFIRYLAIAVVPACVELLQERRTLMSPRGSKMATRTSSLAVETRGRLPVAKTIVAHRSGSQPCAYNESDTLTIDDMIPSFRLSLAEVFRT